jgi:hypothetical protein
MPKPVRPRQQWGLQKARARLAERLMRQDDWRALLASPGGRRLIAGLIRDSGYLAASHTPGDPLATAYREGARALGAALVAAVMAFGAEHWPAIYAAITTPPNGPFSRHG